MANENNWGDGAINNSIGWGQGAINSIGWGIYQLISWAGLTNISGTSIPFTVDTINKTVDNTLLTVDKTIY